MLIRHLRKPLIITEFLKLSNLDQVKPSNKAKACQQYFSDMNFLQLESNIQFTFRNSAHSLCIFVPLLEVYMLLVVSLRVFLETVYLSLQSVLLKTITILESLARRCNKKQQRNQSKLSKQLMLILMRMMLELR